MTQEPKDCPQCGRELEGQQVVGRTLGYRCVCGWPVTSSEFEALQSHREYLNDLLEDEDRTALENDPEE